jgi:hypothetical protein
MVRRCCLIGRFTVHIFLIHFTNCAVIEDDPKQLGIRWHGDPGSDEQIWAEVSLIDVVLNDNG